MPDERLYAEEEIRRIFEAASTEQAPRRAASAPPEGAMTLRELQDIGRQVGIEPTRIAEAAAAIDLAPSTSISRLSTSVRANAPLPRAPSEAEWLMLVTELRTTFDAHGRVGTTNGIYEWSNGNLRAYIEPTMDGYRLRMRTRKSNALAMGIAGVVGLGWSAAAYLGLSLSGLERASFLAPAIVAAVSAVFLGNTLVTLPGWARTRRAQMEHIAQRARALLSRPNPGA